MEQCDRCKNENDRLTPVGSENFCAECLPTLEKIKVTRVDPCRATEEFYKPRTKNWREELIQMADGMETPDWNWFSDADSEFVILGQEVWATWRLKEVPDVTLFYIQCGVGDDDGNTFDLDTEGSQLTIRRIKGTFPFEVTYTAPDGGLGDEPEAWLSPSYIDWKDWPKEIPLNERNPEAEYGFRETEDRL